MTGYTYELESVKVHSVRYQCLAPDAPTKQIYIAKDWLQANLNEGEWPAALVLNIEAAQ